MESLVSPSKPPMKEDKAKTSAGASTAAHKAMIARNLRLVYGEVAGEPIPDKIAELLERLGDAKDGAS